MNSEPVDAEVIEPTGAVVPIGSRAVTLQEDTAVLPTGSIAPDPYIGVAAVPFQPKAQEVLAKYQNVPDDWIDIKPNGQIYLSHMKLRSIFNEAFGFGGWGLVPVGTFHVERIKHASKYPNKPDYEHVTVYREYRLYVDGRFVRQMMGAGDYYTNNAETNYADAVEASESYALNRSGKPFGIAAQCWDKQYVERWKHQYAHQREGKWIKNDRPLNVGAEPSQTAVTTSEPPPQARRSDPAPSSAPTSKDRAIVSLASEGKAWTYKGVDLQMFTDDAGGKWKFTGETISLAKAAIKNACALGVEYHIEVQGNYRNRVVVDAHKVE